MTERTKKIKGLISGQVDMGTFGLVELELLAIENEMKALLKRDISGSLDADSNVLLNSVVNIFGRMYGKDKEFGETTVGGRLIEEIKLKLAKDRKQFGLHFQNNKFKHND